MIERGTPGFAVGKAEKMGWRASDTGELVLGLRVPEENLLGDEGAGFFPIMANFATERISLALGAIAGCTPRRHDRLRERASRVRAPIGRFQVVRDKLADDCDPDRGGARADLRGAATVDHRPGALKSLIAKLFDCRATVMVADEAVQIHGGSGYMREYVVDAGSATRASIRSAAAPRIMNEIIGKQLGL